MKSSAGKLGSKPYDADAKKPVVRNNQHRGSTVTEKQKKNLQPT